MTDHATKAQRLAKAVGEAMHACDHAVKALGIVLEEVRPGYARLSMTIKRDMLNSHQTCHGGMSYTLADAAFGYAANSHNHIAVAATCDMTYLIPGKEGDVLTAIGEERYLRGRNGVYDITITNQNGEVVAIFRGRCRRIQGEVVPGLQV